MSVKINPRKLNGPWTDGYALDLHTTGSTFLGYDAYGHPVFDTQRSPLGELLYRLKNQGDQSAVNPIVDTVVDFLKTWRPRVDAIVRVPPSNTARKRQPVMDVAAALTEQIGIPLCDSWLSKVRSTRQLKDVFDYAKRAEILTAAFSVDEEKTRGKRLLLFDDLYRSGATVRTITLLFDRSRWCGRRIFANLNGNAETFMTSVFIGGSRAVSQLNSVVRAKLDDLIGRGCTILVGDANGADKAVQGHLADRGYRKVVVYCMDDCRNNLASWPTKQVSKLGARKDFSYYAAKDRAMAVDTNCGVMLWDGKSKGTLNDIQNLISMGKKTLVYFAPEKTFHKLLSEQDLRELLPRCNRAKIREAQRHIKSKIPAGNQLFLDPTHS